LAVLATLSGKEKNSVPCQSIDDVDHVGDHGIENFDVRVGKESTNLHLGRSKSGVDQFGDFVKTFGEGAPNSPGWIRRKASKRWVELQSME
jgi:hypothetical protein